MPEEKNKNPEAAVSPEGGNEPEKSARKKKIWIPVLCVVLALACAGVWAFSSFYVFVDGKPVQRSTETLDLRGREVSDAELAEIRGLLPDARIITDVTIGGVTFSSQDRQIVTGDFTRDELPLFDRFEALERADVSACGDLDTILALEERLGSAEIIWSVPLAGGKADGHSDSLAVTSITAEELGEALVRLPYVRSVSISEPCLPAEEQLALMDAWPRVYFTWPVSLAGMIFDGTETEFILQGTLTRARLEELSRGMRLLPGVEKVVFPDTDLPDEALMAFVDESGIAAEWNTELFGVAFSTGDRELIFNDIPMEIEDLKRIEALLPYMPALEKVEMLNCGISNEDMDALNKSHSDVEFIWMVNVYGYGVRTDQTFFSIYNCPLIYVNNGVADQLRYCHDMVAIDLGHMHLFGDLDFFTELPHLKYLIIAMVAYNELPQLASLKELVWLEAGQSSWIDLSPLLEMPNLKHLNIAYKKVPTEEQRRIDVDILKQLTGLERLWIGGNMYGKLVSELEEALPDTEIHIVYGKQIFEGGWRDAEEYFNMRDAMHMYYMNDDGQTVRENPYTGKRSEYEWTNPFH